jgi:hypothetical protein
MVKTPLQLWQEGDNFRSGSATSRVPQGHLLPTGSRQTCSHPVAAPSHSDILVEYQLHIELPIFWSNTSFISKFRYSYQLSVSYPNSNILVNYQFQIKLLIFRSKISFIIKKVKRLKSTARCTTSQQVTNVALRTFRHSSSVQGLRCSCSCSPPPPHTHTHTHFPSLQIQITAIYFSLFSLRD